MSDIRSDYGHEDPWGEFDPDTDFGGDILYNGDHETIPDLLLLSEVCVAFEHITDDFRYHDRFESRLVHRWDEESPFSEAASRHLADIPTPQ